MKSVKFSSDNKKLYSCSADKTIILWDLETGEIINKFKERYAVCNLAFN